MKKLFDKLENVKHIREYFAIMGILILIVTVRILYSNYVQNRYTQMNIYLDNATYYHIVSLRFIDSVNTYPGTPQDLEWRRKAGENQIISNRYADSAKYLKEK